MSVAILSIVCRERAQRKIVSQDKPEAGGEEKHILAGFPTNNLSPRSGRPLAFPERNRTMNSIPVCFSASPETTGRFFFPSGIFFI